jgi:hypothetical protein
MAMNCVVSYYRCFSEWGERRWFFFFQTAAFLAPEAPVYLSELGTYWDLYVAICPCPNALKYTCSWYYPIPCFSQGIKDRNLFALVWPAAVSINPYWWYVWKAATSGSVFDYTTLIREQKCDVGNIYIYHWLRWLCRRILYMDPLKAEWF